MTSRSRLVLPTVSLCAVASVNVSATLDALQRSRSAIDFGRVILFTNEKMTKNVMGIAIIPIEILNSSQEYSHFILSDLPRYIETDHVLIIQWDGFVIEPNLWSDTFLDYDYIGAVWPQFADGGTVGNGGFSLRSRRLLDACRDPDFRVEHPEDTAICRKNRRLLEEKHGIRFAPPEVAKRFSYERQRSGGKTFGFHGIFNLLDAVGPKDFADIYLKLDDRTSAVRDTWLLVRQCANAAQLIGYARALRILVMLSMDRLRKTLR